MARCGAVVDCEVGADPVPVNEIPRDRSNSGCTGPAEEAGIIPTRGMPRADQNPLLGPKHLSSVIFPRIILAKPSTWLPWESDFTERTGQFGDLANNAN